MEHSHPYGKPEQILEFADNNEIIVNDATLKQMLEHADVRNRKIVAFSIIGAFRRGKSFFLDYCLRFLYANYASINQPDIQLLSPHNWMGDENEGLKGFSWRSGSARDTTGIMIWNDVFLHTDERNGDEIAIIVIDTQGLFDNETATKDNSRIFALGTLISSIQVLNLSNLIQEDQLQYLQFASEFAKFAASDNHKEESGKPFQNLIFLIRDWQYPKDHKFGIEGGQNYLDHILKTKQNQNEELKSVRNFVSNSFDKLNCALLPNPGDKVAVDDGENHYDGHWGGMKENFKNALEELIKNILSPENLVYKRMSGNELTSIAFKEYIMQYFKLFQTEKLPETKSIYETTIEKHMEMFTAECIDEYKQTVVEDQNLITTVDQIRVFHDMSRYKALAKFNESKKMGSKSHANRFKETLESEMNKYYAEWSDIVSYKITRENEDKERIRLRQEEENRTFIEKLENKLIDAEERAEMEREKLEKEIEYKETIQEKDINEIKLKADHERTLRDETGKHNEEKQKMLSEQHESKLKDAEKFSEMEKEKLRKEIEVEKIIKQKEVEEATIRAEYERILRDESGKYSEENKKLMMSQLESKLNDVKEQAEIKTKNAEKEIAEMKLKLEKEEKLKNEEREQQRIKNEKLNTELIETKKDAEVEKEKLKKEIQIGEILKQKEVSRADNAQMLKIQIEKHNEENKNFIAEQFKGKLSDAEKRAQLDIDRLTRDISELKSKLENERDRRIKAEDELQKERAEARKEIENMRSALEDEKIQRVIAKKDNEHTRSKLYFWQK